MPHASMRISTSPGPGALTSTVVRVTEAWACGRTAAAQRWGIIRSRKILQEVIGALLATDGGGIAVARNHDGVLGERQQLVMNRAQDLLAIAARQVRTADAVAEERVAGHELAFRGNPQTDAALRVAGRVQDV